MIPMLAAAWIAAPRPGTLRMDLDRSLYARVVGHAVRAISAASVRLEPFPFFLVSKIFPDDIYRKALAAWPDADSFQKASLKHHSNEYGGSTRTRMNLCEAALAELPAARVAIWRTLRAAVSAPEVKRAVFAKLGVGLVRRFALPVERAVDVEAYPRGVLYSETEGYRIAPHPDTREKIVTMQFAFPSDEGLKDVGTEFYSRSVNPMHYLREPKGFVIRETMPFLPNHAYAFSVLNTVRLKSWHGRCKIAAIKGVRNSMLHIWYAKADETHRELDEYQRLLTPHRIAA